MATISRIVAGLIGLAWSAAWAALLVLVWVPERVARLDVSDFRLDLDVSTSGAERLLATLVVAALISVGLSLCWWALASRRAIAYSLLTDLVARRLGELDIKLQEMNTRLTSETERVDSLQASVERMLAHLDDDERHAGQTSIKSSHSPSHALEEKQDGMLTRAWSRVRGAR